jgi:hypothetical protein
MRLLIAQDQPAAKEWLKEHGWVGLKDGKRSREAKELEVKLEAFGLRLP